MENYQKFNIEFIVGEAGIGKTEYIKLKLGKSKFNLVCYKNLASVYQSNYNLLDTSQIKNLKKKLQNIENEIIVIDNFEESDFDQKKLINVLEFLFENKRNVFWKNKWYISIRNDENGEISKHFPWIIDYLIPTKKLKKAIEELTCKHQFKYNFEIIIDQDAIDQEYGSFFVTEICDICNIYKSKDLEEIGAKQIFQIVEQIQGVTYNE